MTSHCDVAIVGAGPYGLSLAAHLAAQGISFRIFGKALHTWRNHMPPGMCLKSDGFASNLSAPDSTTTFEAWCRSNRVPYPERDIPVKLDDFLAYAGQFTADQVPTLEQVFVTNVAAYSNGFALTLTTGERLTASRVVLAPGVTWFKHMPAALGQLSVNAVSHSYDCRDYASFKDREVIVVGAGSSAIDTAVALHGSGARVRLVSRRRSIPFHEAPDGTESSLWRQLQNPGTGIGPGWRSFFCCNAPLLFHRLPEELRLTITRRHLGPAPGWFMRDKVEGRIPQFLGQNVTGVAMKDGRCALELAGGHVMTADHIIAGTGYRCDLSKLPFLDHRLCERVEQVQATPVLSDNFESSVRGLYFLGMAAANSFGPLMRFMVGAEFAAPRLADHLQRRSPLRRAA